MAKWFLKRMEGNVQTEVGPLRPNEILRLVRKGEIKPETFLRKDNSAWFAAKEVGGLFEAAVRQEVQYYCPSCNRQISRPPVTCPTCLRDLGKGEAREIHPEKMSAKVEQQLDQPEENQDEGKRSVQSWLKKKVGKKPS